MAVAAASSAIGTQVPRASSPHPRANPPMEKAMAMGMMAPSPRNAAFGVALIFQSTSSSSSTRSLAVLASKSQDKQVNLNVDNPDPAFTFKEDLNYLLKLGGGSILGAAAIKYGSILLPEITRPNIVQALAIISAPVVVAVLLLINESRKQ